MRRLFWMIAGALIGVTGYRRVSRLARAVSLGGRRGWTHGQRTPGQRTPGGLAQGVTRFARDVRDGMELYTDRHPRRPGRTLEGQRARAPRLDQAGRSGEGPGRAHPRVDYAKDGR